MKIIKSLLIVLTLTLPSISYAAFATCEDARNSGRNFSVLFAMLVYERMECNVDLMDIYESSLAKIGSYPLNTNDSDGIKVCYFKGFYDGLAEQIPQEYGKCYNNQEPSDTDSDADTDSDSTFSQCIPFHFQCIPIETMAMYAANVLIGASLSTENLTEADVQTIFSANPEYEICEELTPGSCENRIVDILEQYPEIDQVLIDLLIERLCP